MSEASDEDQGPSNSTHIIALCEAYQSSPVAYLYNYFDNYATLANTDTAKAAARIIEGADEEGMLQGKAAGLLRLPLGTDAGQTMKV